MNTPTSASTQPALPAADLARLHDEAHHQAQRLRREAIANFGAAPWRWLRAWLASALTELSTQHLGKRKEVTAVIIHDLPAARWHVGGTDVQGPTACLEISITQGTNTAAQKSAFICAAFAELQNQLGAGQPLEPASYVIVRELPASDWGYGGMTQAQRRLASVL